MRNENLDILCNIGYNGIVKFSKHLAFDKWLKKLDPTVVTKIMVRLTRAEETGNFGDTAAVGEGVFEMRFLFGAGYRIYYATKDGNVYFLLGGGDKSTQQRDIRKAIELWVSIRD
ncbi:MAG: type II toxin-antitoxin system RelE/ParE family toxin [Helicobacteraceae bacterium]|nr:type II toxin-antitoxin system RelE/ParE family toxin [Helicobacteraceae bacterium]